MRRQAYDIARQAAPRESYAGPAAAASAPPKRRGHAPAALVIICLLAAAALCVALLLARARVTALADECDGLAGDISALYDEHAHLTVEYEGMYSLAEVEDYAVNVLGMVPASGGGN